MEIPKLIEELRRYGLSNGGSLGRHIGIMDEAADALEKLNDFEHSELAAALAKLKKTTREREALAEKLPRWIPAAERPPEKPGRYLAISEMNWAHGGSMEDNGGDIRRNMIIAYFDAAGEFNVPRIVCWMPLPKPPGKEVKG